MSVPAGWYDDGSGRQRWWDGQQWTDHFAPAAGAETTAEDAQTTMAYPSAADSGPAGQSAAAADGQGGYAPPSADATNPYAAYAAAPADPSGYGPYDADAYRGEAPAPRRAPVLGYIGLGLAVIGGIIGCIPTIPTFGVGAFLLFAAFVVSIIALFIKNTVKWPGIVGLILSTVMGIVAAVVLSVTLFAGYAQTVDWDSVGSPSASDPFTDDTDDTGATPDDAPDDTGATGDRPDAAAVAEGLAVFLDVQDSDEFTESAMLCVAQAVVDSDLSDASVQQIAAGDPELSDPDELMEFGSALTDAASSCAGVE